MKELIKLWHNHQKSWLEKKEVDINQLGADQLVIKSCFSFVSTGTERLMLTSKLDPKTQERMKMPLMDGAFNADFTYGYSLTGIIEHGAKNLVGKSVHLLHPHQSRAVVSTKDITLIPEKFLKKGIFLSNLETVINALWDADIQIGDSVLIIGYGTIGSLLLQIVRHMPGIAVQVVDKDVQKQNLADSFVKGEKQAAYDVVFHTSGTSHGLQLGIDNLEKEGKLIEMSWYGAKQVEVNLGTSFHYDRKKIISSQVSSIPNSKNANWSFERRKQLAMSLLDLLHVDHLIHEEIPFSASVDFFNKLRKGDVQKSGTLIHY